MHRLLVSLLIGLVCAFGAQAQVKHATVLAALNRSALQPGQDAVVAVVLDIKPGFHSQSHTPKDPDLVALVLKTEKADGVTFGETVYPLGREENFPALGLLSIYSGKVIVYVPVKAAEDAKPGPLTLKGTLHYQICNDNSCFAPETTPWSVETKVVGKGEATEAAAAELFKDFKPAAVAATRSTTTAPATKSAG